jgi:hypothetical protein
MIDTFGYSNNDSTDEFDSQECKRVVTIGFFKANLELIQNVPEKYQSRIMFQSNTVTNNNGFVCL